MVLDPPLCPPGLPLPEDPDPEDPVPADPPPAGPSPENEDGWGTVSAKFETADPDTAVIVHGPAAWALNCPLGPDALK